MQNLEANNKLSWLYIDMNSYFASVEQQLDPRLRGKPIAVVPLMSDNTCAIAASYEAKAFGIKTGTIIRDAKKMCPGLILVSSGHRKYVEFHEKVIAEVDKYIPVDTVASIDEFACELQGKECTPEGAALLAKKIKAGIAKNVGEYVKCSIGVAPNMYLAKIAADMQKPNGFTIIEPEEIEQKLLTLKTTDLPGVGRNMKLRLEENGIYTMQHLLALEPKHMRKIWHSVWGERMWYLLRGYDVPRLETNRSTVGHSHVLDPKLRDQKKAYIVAQRLMLKAASRLRRMGYYTKAMSLSFRVQNGPRVEAHKGFYQACDNFTLHKILHELWSELTANINKKDKIKKISVTFFNLTNAEDVQPNLLDILEETESSKIKKYEKVSLAMDALNAKFGRDTIVMGFRPDEVNHFSGTKVAFTRIPEVEEFYE